ncbi:MAG: CIA30 family protein [Pseudomonadota bacterium]|nr:CIA30 family protein [Pseudomonadota bacterium]
MNLLENKKKNETLNQEWEFISDQVMGGVSSGELNLIIEEKEKFLRMSGEVSTENNGGFIQFRSDFNVNKKNYKGIRIKAKGLPSDYYVHIRTNFLFLPWQYYSGKFVVTEEWGELEILFKDFEKSDFYQPSSFTSSEIKSIGFVAFGKDFYAQLDVMKAELF